MIMVVKEEWEGSGNVTKSFTSAMMGFNIINKGSSSLTFTIGSVTVKVDAGESYTNLFEPFTNMTVTASGTYKAEVTAPYGGTITPPQTDTTAPTVTISPAAGTYTASQTLTLSTNETATIYYTLDGTTPTTSSSQYFGPFSISSTKTVKYFAKDTVGNQSTVQTADYTINIPSGGDTTAPTVTISPAAGTYTSAQTVTLSANEAATIYYTIDGSTPTTASTVYSGAIPISATTTLKYFGKDTAGNSSAVQSAAYTINIPASDTTAPVVTASPAAGTYNSTQNVTLTANEAATIYYTTNGTTPTTASSVYSGAIPISATTTLQFIAKDTAGNISTPVAATYTISAAGPTTYLTMNGTTDYIQLPSMTFDKIIMDVYLGTGSNGQILADARNGVASTYWQRDTNGHLNYAGFNDFKVDGVSKTNYQDGVCPDNQRHTYTMTLASAGTDNPTFFCHNNTISGFATGNLYTLKIYNGATLVASYDTSTGTIQDQTGNGYHGTLTGGTWVGTTPRTSAQYLQLNGGADKIRIPKSSTLDLVNNFTISAKFAVDAVDTNGSGVIQNGSQWQMAWDGSTHKATFYATGQTGSYPDWHTTEVAFTDGAIHTLVYQYDGTTWTTFKDGSTFATLASTFTLSTTQSDVIIGNGGLKAKIVEMKVIKNGTTVLWIDCTKGNLQDQSGTGNHGILTGGTWVV